VRARNLKRLGQALRTQLSSGASDARPPLADRADDIFELHLMSPDPQRPRRAMGTEPTLKAAAFYAPHILLGHKDRKRPLTEATS